jgi:hypothetical protein
LLIVTISINAKLPYKNDNSRTVHFFTKKGLKIKLVELSVYRFANQCS